MVSLLKRLGVAGFLFFLIKGLLWLIIPGAMALWAVSGDDTASDATPEPVPATTPNTAGDTP